MLLKCYATTLLICIAIYYNMTESAIISKLLFNKYVFLNNKYVLYLYENRRIVVY